MSIEINTPDRPNVSVSRPVATGDGISDHGQLTGLLDDDHPQYLTKSRADALYDPIGNEGVTDHGALTGLGDDDHPQYLNQGRGDARYALTVHAHDQYLVPAEVIAGTNVNVDSTTTPGSVIINAEGIVTGGMAQGRWRWLPAPQTGSLSSGRCGVDNDQVGSATTFYIHKNSDDGADWSYYLSQLDVGWYVYGQALADSTSWTHFAVTGPSSLTGDTWEVPITVDGGSPQGTEPGNNANVAIGFESPRIVDHAALSGLNNDDHPQYLTEARGDARYATDAELATKADTTYVDSRIWKGTQAQYDALGTYDPTVLYVVTG